LSDSDVANSSLFGSSETTTAHPEDVFIKESNGAIKWTRLSCRTFAANTARLQIYGLPFNLGNFLRTLATPEPIKNWSLTSLKGKLINLVRRS
jgi:hypothetical protein